MSSPNVHSIQLDIKKEKSGKSAVSFDVLHIYLNHFISPVHLKIFWDIFSLCSSYLNHLISNHMNM